MKIKFWLIAWTSIALLLFSCVSDKNDRPFTDILATSNLLRVSDVLVDHIDLHPGVEDMMDLSQKKDGSILGEVIKVIKKGELYYLLDWSTKGVQAFNVNGEHEFQISSLGKGVGESIFVVDFYFCNAGKDIGLVDIKLGQVHIHDLEGAFKYRMKPLGFFTNAVTEIEPNVLFATNYSSKAEMGYLVRVDSNLEYSGQSFLFDQGDFHNSISHPHFFVKDGADFLYADAFENAIYALNKDSIDRRWYIDFGDFGISREEIQLPKFELHEVIMRENRCWRITNFCTIGDVIYFNYQKGRKLIHLFYNSENKELRQTEHLTISGMPVEIVGYGYDENILIALQTVGELSTSGDRSSLLERYEIKEVPNLEFSNPILLEISDLSHAFQ